ncbi:hypothetical protein M2272_005889 [Mycobacterium frederiksbergense]|uniref:Uncharacterized protein n=1 Tax=Mycolicibacterium frederiksbergense TaxID=117567 RepID=A0ABT6L8E1_9MYCO|nr:hypothetical protein [Mycolicibacterium frederiksbergense]MDH6199221.1 hypothetical protein [Mycolicibacterium frederiksbergense]
MALPNAEHQCPACGACGGETCYDDGFVCEDCQLFFNRDSLEASFLDPGDKECREPCDNKWHGDHLIKPGWKFQCGTCELPAGHKSLHFYDCQPVKVAEVPPDA